MKKIFIFIAICGSFCACNTSRNVVKSTAKRVTVKNDSIVADGHSDDVLLKLDTTYFHGTKGEYLSKFKQKINKITQPGDPFSLVIARYPKSRLGQKWAFQQKTKHITSFDTYTFQRVGLYKGYWLMTDEQKARKQDVLALQ